jgi:hypothetical protein
MRIYLLLLFVLSILSLLWGIKIDNVSWMWLYDHNYGVFHDKLTGDEVRRICWTVSSIMRAAVVPTMVVNVLWLTAGIIMFRRTPLCCEKKRD